MVLPSPRVAVGLSSIILQPARERRPFSNLKTATAPGGIEGSVGAQEVQGIVLAWIPGAGNTIKEEGNLQIIRLLVGGLNLGTNLITQCYIGRADIQIAIRLLGRKRGNGQPAVNDSKGGAVLELPGAAVLDTNHLAGKDRETGIPALDHCRWVGNRVQLILRMDMATDNQQ